MSVVTTTISLIMAISLATCGVVESIQESDSTKLTLVIVWLTTGAAYLVLKKRALCIGRVLEDIISGKDFGVKVGDRVEVFSLPFLTGEPEKKCDQCQFKDECSTVENTQDAEDKEKLHVN